MEVIIDSREQNRIKPALFFFGKKNHVNVQELPIGDYIFQKEDKKVVFEYKTCYDFINSVRDGRIFNQAINQSKNFKHHYIVLEYTEGLRKSLSERLFYQTKINFSKAQFYGAIAKLNTFTTVITGESMNLCFEMMEAQAKHCFDEKVIVKKFNKSKGTPAFRLLFNIVDGVGEVNANNICNTLNLRTVEDVLKVNKEDLVSVDGIGDKKADKILSQLKEEYM